MFLEVRKGPLVYMQHIAMDPQYLAPVTSHFRINLGLIAEMSMYTLKENKSKKLLDGQDFEVPAGSQVIHLEMSYTHSSHHKRRANGKEFSVNERYFYKLLFLPGAESEFLRLKSILDRLTLQD